MIRRTVYFGGRVQGVGFRYTARSVAGRYSVTGFVRNMDDGRVEMVVEGDEAEIGRMLEDLKERMVDYIARVDATTSPATGQFDSFAIRH